MEPVPICYTPSNVFKGRNFITPNVESYYRGTYQSEDIFIELSSGTGMNHEILYGVTIRKISGPDFSFTDDPSKCCFSLKEAHEYIASFQSSAS